MSIFAFVGIAVVISFVIHSGYIIKNWGYWRLYNNQGNEITILERCHKSLIECKKTLLYVLTHNKEVA